MRDERARKKEHKEKDAADKIAKKARYATAEGKKRIDMIPSFTVHVNKYTNNWG